MTVIESPARDGWTGVTAADKDRSASRDPRDRTPAERAATAGLVVELARLTVKQRSTA